MSFLKPIRRRTGCVAVALLLHSGLTASPETRENEPAAAIAKSAAEAGPIYRIGPEDSLLIRVLDVAEIPDKPVKVDASGFIDLPLAGRVQASGKTLSETGAAITARLAKFVRSPQVTVSVAEYRSQPVSVLGAVNSPGVHQLQGPKRLVEILSLAGGLRNDAGMTIQLTREAAYGALPLRNARTDMAGGHSTATIDLDALLGGKTPAENILVQPHDIVSVPKADIVYVIGEVRKAGGFTLKTRERMTLLQALSLAEGMAPTAAAKHAKILRVSAEGANRTELPVNVSAILANRAPDIAVHADDIVVIPNNAARSVMIRSAETAVQIATGMLIFRR